MICFCCQLLTCRYIRSHVKLDLEKSESRNPFKFFNFQVERPYFIPTIVKGTKYFCERFSNVSGVSEVEAT